MPGRARESFAIGGARVRAGSGKELEIPITRLITGDDVSLPVRVVHGREPGPVVWVSAAIHGDEVLGIEIIRRVLLALDPKTMHGTLLAVPVVNVLGFMAGDRYLPDRRDLNRSFPGSARGSLASRIAHLLMNEVVAKCDYGIDLHSASGQRTNLPQIRADLEDARTRELAQAFAPPVMLNARTRDGSLRQAARERGVPVLLYEGGERWRFDATPIEAGTDGVLRLLSFLGMTKTPATDEPTPESMECHRSGWVRARRTGILHLEVALGQRVEEGQRLGGLSDTFGRRVRLVHADRTGIVIGLTQAPIVNSGDAIAHIAEPVADA